MSDNETDDNGPAVQFPDEMDAQFAHDLDLFGLLQSLEWFLDEYPLRDEVAESVADSGGDIYGPSDVLAVLAGLRSDLDDREVKPDFDADAESFDFGSGEVDVNLDAIKQAFEGSDLTPDHEE